MSTMYSVSSSPHMRTKDSVRKIMLDVLIALMPAALFSIWYFGIRSAVVIIVCVASSVLTEWIYNKAVKQPTTIRDLSAAVTGVILAFNLPYTVPLWIPIIGSFVAIIIIKQLFGGIGQNFMNPASGARAFLLISFAGHMTNWGTTVDGVSMATPLGIIAEGIGTLPPLWNTFIGTIPGSLGETSALALMIGGAYLLIRKVITWRIPTFYLGTVILMVILVSGDGFNLTTIGYQLFSGGIMIGAIFMATDYSSSPISPLVQIIMGVGCGVLTILIRLVGAQYPEGVSFSIIIMNLFVPLIDKYTVPKVFGEVK